MTCLLTSLFFHFHPTAPVTLSFQSKWVCEHWLDCLVSHPSCYPKLSNKKWPPASYSQVSALRHGMTTCSACKSRDPKPVSAVVCLGQDKCSFWLWCVISCSVLRNVSNCSTFDFFLTFLDLQLCRDLHWDGGWRELQTPSPVTKPLTTVCSWLFVCFFGEALLSFVDIRDFSWNTGLPSAVCPLFPRLKRKSNAAI